MTETEAEKDGKKKNGGRAGKNTKKKNYNLELIRMISFVMVIVIHVTNYFCRAYGEVSRGEYLFSLALDTVSRVSVPCFFMITGALLLGRRETLEKQAKRFLRFGMVLAVWSVIYYLWNTFYMGSGYDLREILSTPVEAHLWYLYAMIPIYFVMPFFQIMCAGMDLRMERAFLLVITAAVIFNYILTLQHEEAYYDIPLIGDQVYSYYVFIGYYIYKYRRHIRIGQGAAAAGCLACLAATFGITWGMTAVRDDHYETALQYGSPLLVAAGALFFLFVIRLRNADYVPQEPAKKIIDLFCGCSFGIYLIHILFLDSYKKYMEPADLSAWVAVPLLTAAIAAASCACIWALRRTRGGRMIT